jgi:hypothetical protein
MEKSIATAAAASCHYALVCDLPGQCRPAAKPGMPADAKVR